MKLYLIIILITTVSIAGPALVFFMPLYQENIQICANIHDEMSSLIPEKEMSKIKDLGNKYHSYKCHEKIDQWKDLAEYDVYRTT